MTSRKLLLALPGVLLAFNAWSAGAHGGGHHGDEEAIGKPGDASKVTRTIRVDMTDDMRFKASKIAVKQGETIRFVVKNSGKIRHEMVLGTPQELREHAEAMKKNPGMEHADANQVTLDPGKTGEIVWQFTKAGKVDFACLQPGHYEAGMKGMVTVAGGKPMAGHAAAMKEPMKEMHAPAVTTAAAQAPAAGEKKPDLVAQGGMTGAEVRKIDKDNGKITLKHGEIKNMDMPAMTMVFQVSDPKLLDKVKVGDKVSFKAGMEGGKMVVTEIEPAR